MFTVLIWLFLFLAIALLVLAKTNPALKKAAYVLPVLALFLFFFRPTSSPSGGAHASARFREGLAVVTGGHLAAAMEKHIPEEAVVVVLHPEKESSTYRQIQARHLLEGIQNGFSTLRPRVVPHPVPDTLYVDLATLNQALGAHPGARGVILIGLQIVTEDDVRAAALPPIVLSDLGDPGSSEWALQNGVAVAALFQQGIGSDVSGKINPEAYFRSAFEMRTPPSKP